jgi:hypothetical protein
MTDRTKITLSDMRSPNVPSGYSIVSDGTGTYTHQLISGSTGTHDAVAIRGVDVVNWPPTASGQTFVYDGSVWAPGTISGGGGATTFLQLTDTPSSYTSSSGYYVSVKDTEDGLEFTFATPSSGIQGVDVQKDDVEEVSLATILNFEGGAVSSITDEGGGKATIYLTASGSTALGELSNVTVQDHPLILDNELLAWDSPSQLWRNQDPTEAGLAIAGHSHAHDSLTNVLIDQHHPRDHAVDGSTHTLASSVSGYIMQAHSGTTFGFTPLLAQDLPAHTPSSHTHVEADVTNLDHDAVSIRGIDVVGWTPSISGLALVYDGNVWGPDTPSGITFSISVEEAGSEKVSEATILNFVSGASVTDAGAGKANITVSGGAGNGGGAEILEVQVFS